jgi:branched-chain amino acid transport system permease protein
MGVIRPAGEFDASYARDMATIRQPWQWGLLIVFLLGLYTLPLYVGQSTVALVNRIAITVIAVQGLNLLTGYTGQISLGQAAFMTTGGYISALLVNNLGWPF